MPIKYKPTPGDVFIRGTKRPDYPYRTVRMGNYGIEEHLSYWQDFEEAFASAERVAGGCAVIDETGIDGGVV
jgi:hypothetical protein